MMRQATIFFTAILLSFSQAQAQEYTNNSETESSGRSFDFILAGGLTFGGEEIAEVDFVDASDEELTSGGLIDLKAGLQFYTENREYSFLTSIGYHFDSVDASNGDTSFSRYPLDFIAFKHADQHRIGLGVTYHTGVEWEVDFGSSVVSDIDNGTYDFDDATGVVVEYGYSLDDSKLTLAARAVFIEYELSDAIADPLDGNHFGVYAYINF